MVRSGRRFIRHDRDLRTRRRTWVETPEEIEAIRRAHRDFVAASSDPRAIFAEGSGHHVMRDRPDVVLDAVAELVASVRARHR